MTNARTNDITLNTDNLFSLNRMNSDELIEKNLALNVGLDWIWKEKNQEKPKEAALSIGQVIKFNRDEDMPIKSSLQNKNSDLVTKVSYSDTENYNITLKSTLNNSLDHMYYNDLTLKY
ncbi:MAG: LPS assembly protein LptD, partial [Candidatus Fonsibacter sp.]